MAQFMNGASVAYDFTKLVAGTPTYTTVGELVNFDYSTQVEALDDTVHGDTTRTFAAGLRNGGTINFSVRLEADTDSQVDFLGNLRTLHAMRLRFPIFTSGNTTNLDIEADVIATDVSMSAPHDGLGEMSVTAQVSGAPTVTEEAV